VLAMSTRPLDVGPFLLIDHLNRKPDGTVTASLRSGEVVSVQPDGRIETRPAGTEGAWERGTVAGDKIIYNSNGNIYVFAFFEQVPNA
jgi:hypothetical protein